MITINYKGYKIYIRRDSQSNRANGYVVYHADIDYFYKTLKMAKQFIDIVKGE